MKCIESLIYYDGELLFISEYNGVRCIVLAVDETPDYLISLVAGIRDEDLEELRANRLALRWIFLNPYSGVLLEWWYCKRDPLESIKKPIGVEDINPKHLPHEGVTLTRR